MALDDKMMGIYIEKQEVANNRISLLGEYVNHDSILLFYANVQQLTDYVLGHREDLDREDIQLYWAMEVDLELDLSSYYLKWCREQFRELPHVDVILGGEWEGDEHYQVKIIPQGDKFIPFGWFELRPVGQHLRDEIYRNKYETWQPNKDEIKWTEAA